LINAKILECGDPAPLSSDARPHRTFISKFRRASPQKAKRRRVAAVQNFRAYHSPYLLLLSMIALFLSPNGGKLSNSCSRQA